MRKVNKSTNRYQDYSDRTQRYMFAIYKALKEKYESINDEWIGSLDLIATDYETIIQCEQQLKETGLLIANKYGNLDRNPLIKVENDAQIQLLKLIREFGLTPSSAKIIKKDDEPKDETDDELMELING